MTAQTHTNNLMDTAAGIASGSVLQQARQVRLDATLATEQAYRQIFTSTHTANLNQDFKYFLAQAAAQASGSLRLQQHYHTLLAGRTVASTTPQSQAALSYLNTIIGQPNQASKAHIDALLAAGWQAAEVVALAQLITYVSYQARLLEGLSLLSQPQQADAQPVQALIKANTWHQQPTTAAGSPAPTAFTTAQLDWEAWLPARAAATLDDDEAASMKKFGQINSEYFLLLAHQSEVLHTRTVIDRGVFYTPDGLARWARELAAVVVSKVNGCIYCASVHARKAAQYAKEREADVARLLDTPAGQPLATGHDDYLNAVIDFSASLSATPTQAHGAQIQRLRDLGLSELALLDLVQSTAFFAWANRLMLSLGEPALPTLAQGKEAI